MAHVAERKQLDEYLAKKGLKHTQQRQVIFDIFLESKDHITIEELLTKVRKVDENVGYATVYRTLLLLQDCGLAVHRQFGNGQSQFERAGDHHDHLICVSCKQIVEFENEQIETIQDKIAKKHGYQLISHRHELYGKCSKCK